MANTLKFKRGLLAGIPTAALGEPLFTTDTFDLYIGNGTGNTKFQKFIASGTTSQLLRGDGSLLTMPIVLTSPSNGQVLKYNGTSWVNDSDAGITGSLTTNYIPKATSATTLGNSLVFDNGTSVGIGSTTPAERFSVYGGDALFTQFTGTGNGSYLKILNSTTTTNGTTIQSSYFGSGGFGDLKFEVGGSQRFRVTSGGNFIINNASTDNGLRFQVTGDGYFSGNLSVGTTNSSNPLTVYNNTANTTIAELRGGGGSSQSRLVFSYGSASTQTAENAMLLANTSALVTYAFGSRSIIFNTNNVDRATIDASGNLGLGVTPSAWNSGLKVQQIGYSAFILGSGSEQSILGSNWYQNTSSTNVYLNNGFATFYQQVSGQHQWFTAPSGTAGNAITFTQAMTLDASGNLAVGTSTATQRLTVNGTINVHGGGNSFIFGTSGANTRITGDNSGGTNSYLSIFTNGSNRLHIPEGGNVILGWTGSDTGEKLQVNGTMRVSGDLTGSALIQSTNATYGRLKTISGTRNITIESFSADWNYIRSNGLNFVIGTQDSNTLYFRTNDTDRLTISNTGAATFSSSVTAGGYYYVTPSGSAQLYNIVNSNASFTGSYVFQAGGGSAGFGGSIVAYGHSHATKAGWISSCISASSGGKFSVNNSGLGAGSDVFTVDANGAGVFSSSVTAGSLVSGSTTTNGYLTLSRGVNTTFESAIVFRTSGVGNWIVGNRANSTEDFIFYNGTTATDSLRITATTGAATFSSSVGIGGTPAQRLDVQGSANSIQARFGNVAGRGLTIGTSAISGTNDAGVVFNAPTATDGTLIFQTTSVERARISGSGNLLINTTSDTGYKLRVNGTSYFDDNLRFPNLKGCVFVQTGGTLLGSISMDTANQVTIDNNGFAGLSVGGSYTMTGGNLGIGQGGSAFGSGTRVISVVNGTAPSSSVATSFLMYSANVTTGNAAPHFRTENGGIIKLYQQTTAVTSATYIGGAGTTVTDLDTFDGYTIPQIVKALRNAGLLA